MAADDLFNVIPLEPLGPEALGVPSLPAPPVPVQTPVTHPDRGLSTILLALSAALGPRLGAGIPQGVLQGQQQAQTQRDTLAKQDEIANQKQQALYQQEQLKNQALVETRQKTLQTAVGTLRTQLAKVTDPQQYQTQVEGFANLLRANGYRVDANWLRQAAPYVAPSAADRASKALDALLGNPLTKAALAQDPGKVMAGKIAFDANGDGTPEHFTIGELAALAGRPMVSDDQGQPIIPSAKDGKVGTAFQELLTNARATFQATNRRVPTPQEDQGLVKAAIEASKEKPPPPAGAPGGTSEVDDNAQQLVDGNLLPSMLAKRAATYNATLAKANKKSIEQTGHPLNFVKLQLDYDAAKRFVGSMNSSQQIKFRGLAESVVNTIDEVRRLGDELRQGSVQRWNAAKRGTLQQLFGNTPMSEQAAQYVAAVNTLKEEFANLANGGAAPTEAAWSLANGQINGDYGAKDLNASLTEVQRLINYRMSAINDQTPFRVGDENKVTPLDTAKQKLGIK